jgi:hypothetical protein
MIGLFSSATVTSLYTRRTLLYRVQPQRTCYRVYYNASVTAFTTTHIARISAWIHSNTTTASTMASESDPAVTRVTVVLNTPDDWFTWLFIRRDVANRHILWQYINPDVARELLPELTEATEP